MTEINVIFATVGAYHGLIRPLLRSENVSPEGDVFVHAHALRIFPTLTFGIPAAYDRQILIPKQHAATVLAIGRQLGDVAPAGAALRYNIAHDMPSFSRGEYYNT